MSVRGAFVKVKPSAKPDRMYFRQTPKPLQETGTWTPQPHNVSFAGGLKTIQQVGAIPRHGPICRRSCRNTIWLPTTSVLPVDIARNAHNSMAASRKNIRRNFQRAGQAIRIPQSMKYNRESYSRWCHCRATDCATGLEPCDAGSCPDAGVFDADRSRAFPCGMAGRYRKGASRARPQPAVRYQWHGARHPNRRTG